VTVVRGASERVEVMVEGRTLSLSNLDKVMYPEVPFTKAQVIDYYARIAPVMLPHVSGRCMTLRRWPDGVDGPSFFNKRCPSHRPDWLPVAVGPGDRDGEIRYCQLDEAAALVWTANLAAIELHAPMARAGDLDHPTILVFDLDPGPPAGMTECCQVAIDLREVLAAVDLVAFPKTSGSKGLQLYIPLNSAHTHDHASSFALAAGQLLVRRRPDRVLVEMAKALRPGKVFIDWSQNSHHKTTVAPYSLRALSRPTVSTPLRWDEVEAGASGDPLVFEADEVLARAAESGDLFAPVAELVQRLPARG
jgi:bifunctional non-homologous end joining protein LigD